MNAFSLECHRTFRNLSKKKRLKYIKKAVEAWENYVTENNLSGLPSLSHLLPKGDIVFFFKSLGNKEILRYFFEEKLKELPSDRPIKEKFCEINKLWRTLNSSEKDDINRRFREEVEERKKTQETFVSSLSSSLRFEYLLMLQEKQSKKANHAKNHKDSNNNNMAEMAYSIESHVKSKGQGTSKAFELFVSKNGLNKEDPETLSQWNNLKLKKKLKLIHKAIKDAEEAQVSLFEILRTDDLELMALSLNVPQHLLNKSHGSHLFIQENDIGDLTQASVLWDSLSSEKKEYYEAKANDENQNKKAQLDQLLSNFIPKHRSELEDFMTMSKSSPRKSLGCDLLLIYHNGLLLPPITVRNNFNNGVRPQLTRAELTQINGVLSNQTVPDRRVFLNRLSHAAKEKFFVIEDALKQLESEMSGAQKPGRKRPSVTNSDPIPAEKESKQKKISDYLSF